MKSTFYEVINKESLKRLMSVWPLPEERILFKKHVPSIWVAEIVSCRRWELGFSEMKRGVVLKHFRYIPSMKMFIDLRNS